MGTFEKIHNRMNTRSVKWDMRSTMFQSEEVLPMWVADIDFPAPQAVNDALIERAKHGIYGYTFINDTVYDAITSWLENKHNWKIDASSLTFSPSVLTSLYNAIQTFTNPEDNIL